MNPRSTTILFAVTAAFVSVAVATPADASFVNFESQHVHPIVVDGGRVYAVNTPDNRLAVFDVTPAGLSLAFEVPVGLEPVSVALRDANEAWVANHVSDTISVVDLATGNVRATLEAGDEPTDIVFAGLPGSERAFVSVSQEDRIRIYDPSDLSLPPVEVDLFGSDPQALAVSADGLTVFVAIFESGNETTIASFQDVLDHGGLPAPNPPGRPDVGLILEWDGTDWVDELDRSYNDSHPYTLPDHDVAILDATAPVPVPQYIDHVGTLNYNLGVHPTTGDVWVTNTEALNHIRFEPELRGQFLRTRVSIAAPVAQATPTIVDLNPHIDYSTTPGPQGEIDLSLSQPGGLAFTSDGGTAYVTALGSAKVAELDATGAVVARIEVGEGPSGLALDEADDRLYVLNRFDQTIDIVSTTSRLVTGTVSLYDPSPAVVVDGRRFLYDARLSSGHGDVACSSCHAGANMDGIAWDLGDPNGVFEPPPPGQVDPFLTGFHPMKGPMTTQTLRGLDGTQPFHWRGDRPDFEDFNGAFVSLMGRDAELAAGDMQAFKDFIFTVAYPPNPNQNLDRTFPDPPVGPSAERGRDAFLNTPLDGPFRCVDCHAMPTGTNGLLINAAALLTTQDFKIPQLRNMYEKAGFTGLAEPQKRGYGFVHDGDTPSLFEFLQLPVFNFGNDDDLRRDVEAFMHAFDTGTAPAVGAQLTVDATNQGTQDTADWVALMIGQHVAGNAELIVKGVSGGLARGWRYDGGDLFRSDRASEPLIATATLLGAAGAGTELTFTGVPPGCAQRMGIDRDLDGFFDRDELDAGSNPADPMSTPETVGVDTVIASVPVRPQLLGVHPNPMAGSSSRLTFDTGTRRAVRIRIFDTMGRFVTTVLDDVVDAGETSVTWDGRNQSGRPVASGTYFYRFESGDMVDSRSILLLR